MLFGDESARGTTPEEAERTVHRYFGAWGKCTTRPTNAVALLGALASERRQDRRRRRLRSTGPYRHSKERGERVMDWKIELVTEDY